MTLTPLSSLESARKKFYEVDVHHVKKVRIKRFLLRRPK